MFGWFRKSRKENDITALSAEMLRFLSDFLVKAGSEEFPPVAYVIGLPIKEAHTGLILDTSLVGFPYNEKVIWKKYVYREDEDEEEQGKPSVYLDRGSAPSEIFDEEKWKTLCNALSRFGVETKVY